MAQPAIRQPKYDRGQKDGFLAQFQQSLDTLNQINAVIDKNSQDKQQFSAFVKDQLAKISAKVGILIQRIDELKAKLVDLEGQINQNNGGIQNKDAEIVNLIIERDSLTAQLTEALRLRDESRNIASALQTTIDQHETEINRLTGENATLRNDINQLNNDINNRGVAAEQQRAQEIEQLRRDNDAILQRQAQEGLAQQQQLQQQIDANNQRIQELEQQAQQSAAQIQQLQEQLNQRQAALDANVQRIQELEQGIAERDQRIQQLTDEARQGYGDLQQRFDRVTQELERSQMERNGLVEENDDLIDRIVQATLVIQNATQRLRELTDEQFYIQNRGGVQTDVDAIIQQIEGLIQSISSALNPVGSRGAPPPPSGNQGRSSGGVNFQRPVGVLESLSTGQPVNVNLQRQSQNGAKKITIPGIKEMTFSDFMNGLHRKAEQANRSGFPSKYQTAYDSLQNNNDLKNTPLTPNQITQIITNTLNANNIVIKNGQLFGGKKTQKKYKMRKSYNKQKKHQRYTKKIKQRGGFLYGDKKTTSTKSLTNSSKTASTNTISSSTKSQKSNSNKNKKNKNTLRKKTTIP